MSIITDRKITLKVLLNYNTYIFIFTLSARIHMQLNFAKKF